jgi:hypothetical protein
MSDAKEEHIRLNYFAKVIMVDHIRGLMTKLPKNIFLSIPEEHIIYELDDDKLTVYVNGSKSESIECPDYALRYLVATDITSRMEYRAMDSSLMRAFDSSDNAISDGEHKISLIEMITAPSATKTLDLESVFHIALSRFAVKGNASLIPKEVVDGFEVITKRYLRED